MIDFKKRRNNYDSEGFDEKGFNRLGFDRMGYDHEGFDIHGYDKNGFNRDGISKLTGYDAEGYDQEGFNAEGIDREGYNRDGYDVYGYNRDGYDQNGYDREGFDERGFDLSGYNRQGFNELGLDKNGFDKDGYDKDGFNKDGYNQDGFDKKGYDKAGYDVAGFDKDGFNKEGFDKAGYGKDGFDKLGFDRNGYSKAGYDREGFDKKGFNKDGFDHDGFNKKGFDKDGYDRSGFNRQGIDRDGYDREGYDADGYNRDGYNFEGFDKDGFDIDGYDRTGFDNEGKSKFGFEREEFDDEGYHKISGLDVWGYNRYGFNVNGINKYTGRDRLGFDVNGIDSKGFNIWGFNEEIEEDRFGNPLADYEDNDSFTEDKLDAFENLYYQYMSGKYELASELADAYYFGRGTVKDYHRAITVLIDAALEYSDFNAMNTLSDYFLIGEIMYQNIPMANYLLDIVDSKQTKSINQYKAGQALKFTQPINVEDSTYKEEAAHLKAVLKSISDQIKKQHGKINVIDDDPSWMDFDQKQYWLTLKRENREAEEKIQELQEVQKKPYYARIDIKNKNEGRAVYIGENRYIYVGNMDYNVESVWSKYGKWLRDSRRNIVIDDGVNTTITLRRKFTITNGNLEDYYDEYDAESKAAKAAINDPFLLRVLEDRRGEQNITNIIRSIQVNQNDIIEEPIENNLVVQGCAGSGKTMILLHRLANLKYNNPKFDWDKVRIITPNKDFTLFISDLAKDLDIDEIKKLTLQEYYLELLDAYHDQFQMETGDYEKLIEEKGEDNVPKRRRYSLKLETKRVKADKELDKKVVHFLYSDKFIDKAKEYVVAIKEDSEKFVEDFGVAWNYFDDFITDLLENQFAGMVVTLNNYTCVLYAKILFLLLYLGKLRNVIKLLCIDEGQDICENQYELLYLVNREHPNINVYGDLNQRITDNENIDDWKSLEERLTAKTYELNENYRNSDEIITYYNRTLSIKNKSFGIKTKEVERFKVEELDILLKMQLLLKNKTVVITKETSIIPENITSLCVKNGIVENHISVMDVAQVKGLEFDTAFVFDEGMDDNEKYISYTRALSELYVENGDYVSAIALGIAEENTDIIGPNIYSVDKEIYFDDDAAILDQDGIYVTMYAPEVNEYDDGDVYTVKLSLRKAYGTEVEIIANDIYFNDESIIKNREVYINDENAAEQYVSFSFNTEWLKRYINVKDIRYISFSLTAKVEKKGKHVEISSKYNTFNKEGYFVSDAGAGKPPEYWTIKELDRLDDSKILIVVRAGWTNDFCFAVEYFEGDYAVGTQFLSGCERKKAKYPCNTREFRIYDGPSRDIIEE